MRFSKKLLIAMFLFLLLFIIAILVIFYKTNSEPSTLISCVFGFCGIEGGALAWIKTIKEKRKDNED